MQFFFDLPISNMENSQIVHTVCLQTSDAVKKEDGSFTFHLPGDNLRLNAIKVSLGSLEFPMVQYTVEDDWNRFHFSEGLRLSPEYARLTIQETHALHGSQSTDIDLPLYLNKITSVTVRGSHSYIVQTELPHSLWVTPFLERPYGGSFLNYIWWGDAELLCSTLGTVNISDLYRGDKLTYVSENEFEIQVSKQSTHTSSLRGGGYLYIPEIPNPSALCDLLSTALTRSGLRGTYKFSYDPSSNHVTLASIGSTNEIESVRLLGSPLAKLLGFSSDTHTMQLKNDFVSFLPAEGRRPLAHIPADPMPAWTFVEFESGWYAPSHRPMCTGAPLRLSTEAELVLNRLFFQTPERIPKGHATAHFLVFVDPCGAQHTCPIFPGQYQPHTLCRYLEDEMTRQAQEVNPNVTIAVHYDIQSKRFEFSCEIKENNRVIPVTFSLLFDHSASIDGRRLGFQNVAMMGSDTYTSDPVEFGYMKWMNKYAGNVYHIRELSHKKKFLVEAQAPPILTAIIKSYDTSTGDMLIMTHIGQLPCAHGLVAGDTVHISTSGDVQLYTYDEDTSQYALAPFGASNIAASAMKSGVVVELGENLQGNAAFLSVTYARIQVKQNFQLKSSVGKVVQVQKTPSPFNILSGILPKALPPHLLGFRKGAIQYGVDGSVLAGSIRVPPYMPSAIHNLDHPDYVLIYLAEGKKNTSLEHMSNRNITNPFAKLVLYPSFREERMLPRDTTLFGSESLTTFTILFKNPDGTPYHFHNVDFSLSLNFVQVKS